MSTKQEPTTIGCFGCVFWLAVFIAFCMLLIAALQWLWNAL